MSQFKWGKYPAAIEFSDKALALSAKYPSYPNIQDPEKRKKFAEDVQAFSDSTLPLFLALFGNEEFVDDLIKGLEAGIPTEDFIKVQIFCSAIQLEDLHALGDEKVEKGFRRLIAAIRAEGD